MAQIVDMTHAADLARILYQHALNQQFTDFRIRAGSKTVYCHQSVVSAKSEYFHSVCASGMTEAILEHVKEEDEHILKTVLKFLYLGKASITAQNVESLVLAAEFIKHAELKRECEEVMSANLTMLNLSRYHALAKKVGLAMLCDECVRMGREKFAQVRLSDWFLSMSVDEVEEYLEDDDLVVATEDDVVDAIQDWLRHSRATSRGKEDYLGMLFHCIKLPYCTQSKLEAMSKDPTVLDKFRLRIFEYLNHGCYRDCEARKSYSESSQNESASTSTITGTLVTSGGSITLGTSVISGSSATPGESVISGTSPAAAPVTPGTPISSDSSAMPGTPDTSAASAASGTSTTPDASGTHAAASGARGKCRSPDTSATPGPSDTPNASGARSIPSTSPMSGTGDTSATSHTPATSGASGTPCTPTSGTSPASGKSSASDAPTSSDLPGTTSTSTTSVSSAMPTPSRGVKARVGVSSDTAMVAGLPTSPQAAKPFALEKVFIVGGFETNNKPHKGVIELGDKTTESALITLIPLVEFSLCATGDSLIVSGGERAESRGNSIRSVKQFNISTMEWTDLSDMPKPASGHGSACVEKRLFAIGGAHVEHNKAPTTASVNVLDLTANKWSPCEDIPQAVAGPGVAVVEKDILAVGGWNGLTISGDTFKLNTRTLKWTRCTPMPGDCGIVHHSTVAMDQMVYALHRHGFFQYDVAVDQWNELLPPPKISNRCALVPKQGKLLVLGGFENEPSKPNGRIQKYEVGTKTWAFEKKGMPVALRAHWTVGLRY